ncbi:MAG TPA: hypothetical protein VJR94_10465 [Candidatus Nitrosocosmicus sp.]|nr:hypothetical protein [Candidatus Nitrosocosmicus sp.]
MNSKDRQHTIVCMSFSLIVLSFFNTVSIEGIFAFEIGFPDIPFLNFNFQGDDSLKKEDSLSKSDLADSSNFISTDPEQIQSNDLSDGDHLISSFVDSHDQIQSYDSLPFPANTINKVLDDKNDQNLKDINSDDDSERISSNISETLPLITDYTDFPSTFLSSPVANSGNNVQNQHVGSLDNDESKPGLSYFTDTSSENTSNSCESAGLITKYENDDVSNQFNKYNSVIDNADSSEKIYPIQKVNNYSTLGWETSMAYAHLVGPASLYLIDYPDNSHFRGIESLVNTSSFDENKCEDD